MGGERLKKEWKDKIIEIHQTSSTFLWTITIILQINIIYNDTGFILTAGEPTRAADKSQKKKMAWEIKKPWGSQTEMRDVNLKKGGNNRQENGNINTEGMKDKDEGFQTTLCRNTPQEPRTL